MNQNDYQKLYGAPPTPPPMQQQPLTPPPAPRPVTEKKPFNPTPLLLVAGVLFLFLGGVIFLTSTWSMLSDGVRAGALLSASVIAFGVNILAEKALKLPKTGLAFYILGCIFLPLALGGIGVFDLLGEWFSFSGEGASLLWAVIFLSISATAFLGHKNYRSILLVWLSLIGLAGCWTCLAYFGTHIGLALPEYWMHTAFGALLVVFACGFTAWAELYLKRHEQSYITRALPGFLFMLYYGYTIALFPLVWTVPGSCAILAFLMGLLYLNPRLISGTFHCGILGSIPALGEALLCVLQIVNGSLLHSPFWENSFFLLASMSVLLMSMARFTRLHSETVHTYSFAGKLVSIPAIVVGVGMTLWSKEMGLALGCIYASLVMACFFFGASQHGKLSDETKLLCLHTALLFLTGCIGAKPEATLLMPMMLVLLALFLLMGAGLARKFWPMMLAICASLCMVLLHLPQPQVTVLWLTVGALLTCTVYAHRKWRFLLERCCAWAGLAILVPACVATLRLWLPVAPAWTLTLAVMGLVYLAESVLFWKHSRSEDTRPFLELQSILVSCIAFGAFLIADISLGFGIVLAILLLIFAAGFCRKRVNIGCLPQLIMFFFTVSRLLQLADLAALPEPGGSLTSAQLIRLGTYLGMLILFAVTGRLLLPGGFYDRTDGAHRIDWPLLMGIFPIVAASVTLDWYLLMLISLFLSLYAMLFVGRVKSRYIPALLASCFGCLTIFLHNWYDPFKVLHVLLSMDIRTPQILLFLLPMHVFLFSLLWILPDRFRSAVHIARFVMYCITMACLLGASLSFGHVADAITLVVFSFAIFLGSFAVKRLRWFTLGFSVLFIMTIHLTWSFWRSLHWGIYLFLAGAVLITLASLYEYSSRKAALHPDAPRKKFQLFAQWRW
ncbi:MAG: hypothetical protein IJ055_08230 [Oscillospiraceae bacterium]|nr:hypothetical protein [Oscillospiraceae bacterium]